MSTPAFGGTTYATSLVYNRDGPLSISSTRPKTVLVHNCGGEPSDEAKSIAEHSNDRAMQPDGGDHYVRGVDKAALPEYVDGVLEGKVPNVISRYGLSNGRSAFWDPDKGAVVISNGESGSVFTPEDGIKYFYDLH